MTRVFLALAVLLSTIVTSGSAAAQAADWDIPGGHIFTQTGGGSGQGYSVTDEGGVTFWTEFQRLGGVQAVGYPASRRFEWDGFTVQVFQRVVFQWRNDTKQVNFVNVFDRLHDLGKDEFLLKSRQVPPPRPFDDAGKSWPQVVQNHLAVLESHPAIKAKYNAVVGDPIQANGLPVSDVVDMGNHYALRAQRTVFQQWKEDVPWAKAGEVTVALGGDIAKEAGVLPDPLMLRPIAAASATVSPEVRAEVTRLWNTQIDETRAAVEEAFARENAGQQISAVPSFEPTIIEMTTNPDGSVDMRGKLVLRVKVVSKQTNQVIEEDDLPLQFLLVALKASGEWTFVSPAPRTAAPADGACPTGFPIKGVEHESGALLFFTPDMPHFDQVVPGTCFATIADAHTSGHIIPGE